MSNPASLAACLSPPVTACFLYFGYAVFIVSRSCCNSVSMISLSVDRINRTIHMNHDRDRQSNGGTSTRFRILAKNWFPFLCWRSFYQTRNPQNQPLREQYVRDEPGQPVRGVYPEPALTCTSSQKGKLAAQVSEKHN